MKYRFPDNSDGATSDFTVIPDTEVVPDGLTGFNIGGGRVVVMNDAATTEFRANVFSFLEKVNPTGIIADIPFSEID